MFCISDNQTRITAEESVTLDLLFCFDGLGGTQDEDLLAFGISVDMWLCSAALPWPFIRRRRLDEHEELASRSTVNMVPGSAQDSQMLGARRCKHKSTTSSLIYYWMHAMLF
jgi:hypothetical protein